MGDPRTSWGRSLNERNQVATKHGEAICRVQVNVSQCCASCALVLPNAAVANDLHKFSNAVHGVSVVHVVPVEILFTLAIVPRQTPRANKRH
eukprot:15434104-Alexandrium_andersonii.AAC.1